MKKYIFSVLMAAVAAFTFNSCADVPEPYTQPQKPDDSGSTTTGEAKGTGTLDEPYNSVAAIQYCQSLEAGVESDKEIYIKGKVQSIKEEFGSYGNASFYIADDESSDKFYVYRTLYLGNKKWTSSDDQIKVGDEVVVCGKVMNYSGNTPETVQNKTYLISVNGKTAGGSDTPTTGEAKGTGTATDPFNSVAAQKYTAALEAGKATDQEFYIKGKIQKFANNGEFNAQYGNASFYIADDATSEQFYIFRTYYFGGEKWKDGDQQLKVGDEVVVCAKLINYMGNTPETNQGGKLISINGKTSGDGGSVTPDPGTGNEMSASDFISGKISSEDLPENAYGSQDVTNESTWYSWKHNNITYCGAKVCQAKSSDAYAGCIQMQGNAAVAKQGFLFNKTAFSSDIKSITIVFDGSSTYDTPTTFSVFEGTSAHPTTNVLTGTYTKEAKNDKVNVFTMTYDFSSVSSKYFTIWNNAAGALYIEKIIVTLK